MNPTIIHVDMDAFFAAVEIRDNPSLAGKPLIIGALPHERGVVSTCSYEARKFGVRSAMSIKDAYKLCPHGIYMHPSPRKYGTASKEIQKIWYEYTDLVECVSIDEGFLDVSGSAHLFGGAQKIAHEIKAKTKARLGLSCSVGIGYSMMSAKLASEEKKPDGFFEIPNAEALRALIINRGVRTIYGVGAQTAEALQGIGVTTIADIFKNKQAVINLLGNFGRNIIKLAEGIDERRLTVSSEPKSVGKEITFQKDSSDHDYIKDILLLIAAELSFDLHRRELYAQTVTLKITYADMKKITRSKTGEASNKASDIYNAAEEMLNTIENRPIRLAGISLSKLTQSDAKQLTLIDNRKNEQLEKLDEAMFSLQQRFGMGIVKTGKTLGAEKRVNEP